MEEIHSRATPVVDRSGQMLVLILINARGARPTAIFGCHGSRAFHRHCQIVVFDRSWYGRVLVERVEGIASKREWQRGYEEINQFERMLVADGIRIVKCFLHITPEEQIRRFKDRLANPLKRWKLSHEDLRNRSRWTDYEVAVEDMLEQTSTQKAPWHLIPTNDKPYGHRKDAQKVTRTTALKISAPHRAKKSTTPPKRLESGWLMMRAAQERAAPPAKQSGLGGLLGQCGD